MLKPLCAAVLALSSISTVSADPVADMPLNGLLSTQDTSFQQMQGQWLYVDFWASWCGPCKKSFPFMNQLQSAFSNKNLKVVAISVDETEDAAVKFLKYNETNFSVFHDPKGKLAEQFEVPGMPSSYLINPQGEIVYKHSGFTEESGNEIIEVINQKI